MERPGCARIVSSGAYGCISTMCSVRESEARTSRTIPGVPRSNAPHTGDGAATGGLICRSKLAAASPAVSGLPS
jgi:hypothetical protein